MTETLTGPELMAISVKVAEIALLAQELSVEEVNAWADEAHRNKQRHDTLGPILDPSAWQLDHRGIDAAAAVAHAFARFRRTIEEHHA